MIHTVNLKGQPVVWEYPAIPDHLERTFEIETLPGEFQLSIEKNGTWEGFDTLTVLTLLEEGDKSNLVLDFGAHVGWYTLLAASCGYSVRAYDESKKCLDVLGRNAKRNGFEKLVETKKMKFGESTKPANMSKPVELLKADVEGAEQHVVRYCSKLFEKKLIKYALLEMSPVFNDSYPALAEYIIGCGYDAYVMPSKPEPAVREAFEKDVGKGLHLCKTTAKALKNTHQENWLFARR